MEATAVAQTALKGAIEGNDDKMAKVAGVKKAATTAVTDAVSKAGQAAGGINIPKIGAPKIPSIFGKK